MKTKENHLYWEAKKAPHADLHLLRPLLLSVGLCSSLLLVNVAFSIKQRITNEEIELSNTSAVQEEILDIPITQMPPPPPSVQLPQIVEVPNEIELAKELDVTFDVEVNLETKVQEITINTDLGKVEEEVEKADEIFVVVEESALPIGGMAEFYKQASENIKYPAQARRLEVEGKVFVEFVVGKDGKIQDVKLAKGIGAGCDEEAMRVLALSPPWKPAKQRGKPVKQRIVLPIFFMLRHQ